MIRNKRFILWLFTIAFAINISAQETVLENKVLQKLQNYFLNYKAKGISHDYQIRMTGYKIDPVKKVITINVNDYFASQEFTEDRVETINKKVRKILDSPINTYKIRVVTNGMPIEQLMAQYKANAAGMEKLWGDIDYEDEPWVWNESKPISITHGLNDRHISIWASHGRYFDNEKNEWRWQRPNLFCTTEDLFTQTIVVPFLIPMLEHAGACVFTPRERDWQTNEVIVDNDFSSASSTYQEYEGKSKWDDTKLRGFKFHSGIYVDNENPFTQGTARMAKATKNVNKISLISYKPNIPEAGRYAVYVSYQTMPKSVPDAEYIVFHKGQETHFRVNQKMGGGTWVYLGTFDFDKGSSDYNRVVLTNQSSHRGVVTADAVRFGGGMGNIQRGGSISGYPRALEGARYTAQWSGAPYSVYSSKGGSNDYADDINVRSYITNWLGGGSIYMPTIDGKNVPIELSLAIHSDAGFAPNGKDLVGSLSICTTNFNDGLLSSGVPRLASKQFAKELLDNLTTDIKYKYKNWTKRYLWDRNYSETRNPEVPSAILETLSHQNFPDMELAQDPNFRFTIARSIYKTILRYISTQHGRSYVIEPLQPQNFSLSFVKDNTVKLSWTAQSDPQEPSAQPSSYIVYTSTGNSDFDNGQVVNETSFTMQLEPDIQYNFKVSAVNRGGESFPTEVLSAVYHSATSKTVLIVNGFHRLSAPKVIDDGLQQGFDLNADAGVSFGLTAGWNGVQQEFNKSYMGKEGPGGLGYGGDELAGHFIAGNDFNYVAEHAQAIASTHKYNVISCCSKALEQGRIPLNNIACLDLILGLEKYDIHQLAYYKTFSPQMRNTLQNYVQTHKGSLLVSGSYIGSDMQGDEERSFLQQLLKVQYGVSDSLNVDNKINGLGTTFDYYHTLNKYHYAATHPEILQPTDGAFCAMQYSNQTSAAVAYDGTDYKAFTMGLPFECIQSVNQRNSIMHGILNFLIK